MIQYKYKCKQKNCSWIGTEDEMDTGSYEVWYSEHVTETISSKHLCPGCGYFAYGLSEYEEIVPGRFEYPFFKYGGVVPPIPREDALDPQYRRLFHPQSESFLKRDSLSERLSLTVRGGLRETLFHGFKRLFKTIRSLGY